MEKFSKPGAGQLEIEIWTPARGGFTARQRLRCEPIETAHLGGSTLEGKHPEVIFKKIRDAFNLIINKASESIYLHLASQYSSVMNIKTTYNKHKIGGFFLFWPITKIQYYVISC